VTLITQIVVSLFNLRGLALRLKVTNLLVLIDNGIHPRDAALIAGLMLRNALIGKPGLPWLIRLEEPTPHGGHPPGVQPTVRQRFKFGLRPASIIQREELTRLLLAFGKKPSEYPDHWRWMWRRIDTRDLQAKVRTSLKANGVPSPEKALADIRRRTQELEHARPELSNSERNSQAILEFAKSDFVGKLNGWFDQSVDRAGDLFAGWTHVTAFLVAMAVAIVLQLDTIGLINRLSTDSGSRSRLVELAAGQREPGPAHALTGRFQQALSSAAAHSLADRDLLPIPDADHWWARWSGPVPCPADLAAEGQAGACTLPRVRVLGVALSAFLLSLGGPFWYSTLSGLLKLRSTLADKDDDQRKDRQSNTAPKTAAG
jgi:hypothetical protein